jgi:hypothetical protein
LFAIGKHRLSLPDDSIGGEIYFTSHLDLDLCATGLYSTVQLLQEAAALGAR